MNQLMANILNFSLYQLGWFSCLLGAAAGYPLSGGLAALALIGVHLIFCVCRLRELQLILLVCLLGVLMDSLQQAFGLVHFRSAENWPLWLPLWIFAVWAQFATLLRYSLDWLNRRYLPAALLGAVGGPLAYFGGVRLGAADFPQGTSAGLVSIGLCWLCVMPLILWIRRRIAPERGIYRGWVVLWCPGDGTSGKKLNCLNHRRNF